MQPSTCDTAAASNGVRGRPRMGTVFGAAFVAGALAAFGINRALDVHLAQARPQVECEPIFVALRSLPQGTPITVWDVALRDWPKAMLPAAALRAHDTFEGMVLRHPLREGQPLIAAQLVKADDQVSPARLVGEPSWPAPPAPAAESWTPARAETAAGAGAAAPAAATADATTVALAPAAPAAPIAEQPATGFAAEPGVPATETASTATSASEPVASETVADESASGNRLPQDPAVPDTAPAPVVAADAAATERRPAQPAPAETASFAPTAAKPDAAAGPATALTDLPATGGDVVDELPPVDAATATVTDVVADLPPVATPNTPTPADPAPAQATVNVPDVGSLAAPVPMSPPTDIESPLASITATRPRAAKPESSVLERSAAAAPPAPRPAAPQPAAPLRYLVVPERIALQADASFVMPQPERDRNAPATNREASAQPRPRTRGPAASSSRSAGPASTDGQRRPAAAAPRQASPGRAEAASPKAGGWLPKLGFGGFGSNAAR